MFTLEELSNDKNYGDYDTIPDTELMSVLESTMTEYGADPKRFKEDLLQNSSPEKYVQLARGMRKIATTVIESIFDVEGVGWSEENLLKMDNILNFTSVISEDAADFLMLNNISNEIDTIHFLRHAANHYEFRIHIFALMKNDNINLEAGMLKLNQYLENSLRCFSKALTYIEDSGNSYTIERYSIFLSRLAHIVDWCKVQPSILESVRSTRLSDILKKVIDSKETINLRNERIELAYNSLINASHILTNLPREEVSELWRRQSSLRFFAKQVSRSFMPFLEVLTSYDALINITEEMSTKERLKFKGDVALNHRIMIAWEYYKIIYLSGIPDDIWNKALKDDFSLQFPIELTYKALVESRQEDIGNLRTDFIQDSKLRQYMLDELKKGIKDKLFEDMYLELKSHYPEYQDSDIANEMIEIMSTRLYPLIGFTTKNQVNVFVQKRYKKK